MHAEYDAIIVGRKGGVLILSWVSGEQDARAKQSLFRSVVFFCLCVVERKSSNEQLAAPHRQSVMPLSLVCHQTVTVNPVVVCKNRAKLISAATPGDAH
jgi:hypothetical protein